MTTDRHDSGCKVWLPLLPGVVGNALFLGLRMEHRIYLERRPAGTSDSYPYLLNIGMNPSAAGNDMDDITVRKDQEFAKRRGFDRMIKMNVGTYICTQPRDLDRPGIVVNHPENLLLIREYAGFASKIIIACGKVPDVLVPHARTLFRALKQDGRTLWCLGTTKEGWPKHSSRLGYDVALEIFNP